MVYVFVLMCYIAVFLTDPRTPSILQLRDKIVFVTGVANVLLLSFLTHGEPWLMPWYYIVKAPVLISLRVYLYFQEKFQYFLLGMQSRTVSVSCIVFLK